MDRNSSNKPRSGLSLAASAFAASADVLGCSLRADTVTVLVLNLRGFHAATKSLDVDSVLRRYADTVTAVMKGLSDNKGVLDTFQGDHFTATFNAVTTAAQHSRRATVAALRIAAAVAGCGFELKTSAGVATGRALVGNAGNSEMKKFCVVGGVFTQAAALERLCRLYAGATCLVPQRIQSDLEAFVHLRAVDLVQLPCAARPAVILDAAAEVAAGDDDEWLYLVDKAAKADVHAATNAVFKLLASKKYAQAVEKYDSLCVASSMSSERSA